MSFSKMTLGVTTVVIIAVLLGGGIYLRLRPTPEEEDASTAAEVTALEVPEASLESFARRARPRSSGPLSLLALPVRCGM